MFGRQRHTAPAQLGQGNQNSRAEMFGKQGPLNAMLAAAGLPTEDNRGLIVEICRRLDG